MLYIFWTLVPHSVCNCEIFLPFCSLCFHFVDCFFCCEEAFKFDVVPLVDFFLMSYSKTITFKTTVKKIISTFSLKVLWYLVLCLSL